MQFIITFIVDAVKAENTFADDDVIYNDDHCVNIGNDMIMLLVLLVIVRYSRS